MQKGNKMFSILNSSQFFFALFSFSIFLHIRDARAALQDDGELLQQCNSTTNYTSGSQYQSNVNLLLGYLVSNGTQDDFFNASIGASPDTVYGLAQCRGDLSMQLCRNCLRNLTIEVIQSCPNQKGAMIRRGPCLLRYSDVNFFSAPGTAWESVITTWNVSDSGFKIYPTTTPPPLLRINPTRRNKVKILGGGNSTNVIIVSIIASVVLIAICAFFISRRTQPEINSSADIINNEDDIESEENLQFDLNTIRASTSNFSDENKLGQGGFGAVYKGELLDGREIAVKRLSKDSGQSLREFKNEAVLLHKLQHGNLVRLLGYCLGEEEKLLIYEYIPNLSLDKYIFDSTKKSSLDWKKRYNIIGGIARGLLYLHEDSRLSVIHQDLKCGNILLDEAMNAKIADFGMAKLFGVDQTRGNTSKIVGTFGYMAPEYIYHGLFSVKSDVYSFGVLLLEIVSGQSTSNFNHPGSSQNLISYAWTLWKEGNASQLIDSTIIDNVRADEATRCIHIALLCVQENLDARPTMSSVVLMLSSDSITLEFPSASAFIMKSMPTENDTSPLLHSSDG